MLPLDAVLTLLAPLPQVVESQSTGTEWLVIASVLVPAVLLAVLAYLGHKSAV